MKFIMKTFFLYFDYCKPKTEFQTKNILESKYLSKDQRSRGCAVFFSEYTNQITLNKIYVNLLF